MIIGLPLGAIIIGVFLAFFLRSMFPDGWKFAVAFLAGAILAVAMPYGLSITAAKEASGATAGLLPLLGVVSGAIGVIAFVITMVLSGGTDEEDEREDDDLPLPTLYRKKRKDRR